MTQAQLTLPVLLFVEQRGDVFPAASLQLHVSGTEGGEGPAVVGRGAISEAAARSTVRLVRCDRAPPTPVHQDVNTDAETERGTGALSLLSCSVGLLCAARVGHLTIILGGNFLIQVLLLSAAGGAPLFALVATLGNVSSVHRACPLLLGVCVSLLATQAFLAAATAPAAAWLLAYLMSSDIADTNRTGSVGTYNASETASAIDALWNVVALDNVSAAGAGRLAFLWLAVWLALVLHRQAAFVLTVLPACAWLALTARLLVAAPTAVSAILSSVDYISFFTESRTWAAAAQETFLSWGLLVASTMHAAAGAKCGRAVWLAVGATFLFVLTSAVAAQACAELLAAHGMLYAPTRDGWLWNSREPPTTAWRSQFLHVTPLGVTVWSDAKNGDWYPLHLATHLLPAALRVTPLEAGWTQLALASLLLPGVGQLAAELHAVLPATRAPGRWWVRAGAACGLCAAGACLAARCAGSWYVALRWSDYTLSVWWQSMLVLSLLVGALCVRGPPYCAERLAGRLLRAPARTAAAAIAAVWTLLLPVLLPTLCVVDWRAGRSRGTGWSGGVQLTALLLVPALGVVQLCRYLASPPPDILERLRNVVRPRLDGEEAEDEVAIVTPPAAGDRRSAPPQPSLPVDPPPKYTPPPSYSTATGAAILAALRQSFRAARTSIRVRSRPASQWLELSGERRSTTTENEQLSTECIGTMEGQNLSNEEIERGERSTERLDLSTEDCAVSAEGEDVGLAESRCVRGRRGASCRLPRALIKDLAMKDIYHLNSL